MNITRGKVGGALKVVIYGPEGIGKSTLASRFPDPLIIDTEGSTRHLDVARTDAPTSWAMLLSQADYIRANPGICKTLVIDTADWAEQLCIASFCAGKQIKGIEDMGYGKGYVYIAEDFGKLLNKLEEIRNAGVNIVVTAHAAMRKFEQPDELGAYDRWELKLNKKTAALLKEWADVLLFANYKTMVINVDGQGAQKGKNKAQGGKRVLYTSHNPCWDAKNRLGMPEELDMSWEAIRPYVCGDAQPASAQEAQVVDGRAAVGGGPYGGVSETGGGKMDGSPRTATPTGKPGGVLGKLYDLMGAESVTPDEVMEGVAAWPQVLQAIRMTQQK